MANSHWSQTALTVKVFGVNALVTIPLLAWFLRPSALNILLFFILILVFFVYVENIRKLRVGYVLYAIRYALMGTNKTPKSRNFDF